LFGPHEHLSSREQPQLKNCSNAKYLFFVGEKGRFLGNLLLYLSRYLDHDPRDSKWDIFGASFQTTQANLPACSPHYPFNAERQAGRCDYQDFSVLVRFHKGIEPTSTDYEADTNY